MRAQAKLNNCPYPARKMRLLADMVRGKNVELALNELKFHRKRVYAQKLEKLIQSAIANWQQKNEESSINLEELFIKEIFVDNARMLKRIQPAPQGRAHRIRKRFNHITVIVDTLFDDEEEVLEDIEEEELEEVVEDAVEVEEEKEDNTSEEQDK
jgi:large subunit ribosomal protein L22